MVAQLTLLFNHERPREPQTALEGLDTASFHQLLACSLMVTGSATFAASFDSHLGATCQCRSGQQTEYQPGISPGWTR